MEYCSTPNCPSGDVCANCYLGGVSGPDNYAQLNSGAWQAFTITAIDTDFEEWYQPTPAAIIEMAIYSGPICHSNPVLTIIDYNPIFTLSTDGLSDSWYGSCLSQEFGCFQMTACNGPACVGAPGAQCLGVPCGNTSTVYSTPAWLWLADDQSGHCGAAGPMCADMLTQVHCGSDWDCSGATPPVVPIGACQQFSQQINTPPSGVTPQLYDGTWQSFTINGITPGFDQWYQGPGS